MTPAPAVTFVGHDASRTGAPAVLLTMLRWLRHNQRPELQLVLVSGGPLLSEYRAVCPVSVLEGPVSRSAGLLGAAARSIGWTVDPFAPVRRRSARRAPRADVVVANTLAALAAAREIADAHSGDRVRLVCYVHELDGVAARVLPPDPAWRRALLARVDHFAAVSGAVADMLVGRLGVAAERVTVVEPFIEAPAPTGPSVAAARLEMTGTSDRPVVLSVGAMSRRKGPERFVDLMGMLVGHPTHPVGVWLGGDPGGTVWQETATDIDRTGTPGAIRMLPTTRDATPYLAAADLVVSTAIEDPFPLVALEAGASGTPVVGYASGGLVELQSACGSAGSVVEVGDVLALRDVVSAQLDDPDLRAELGGRASSWIRAHRLVDQAAPALWKVIVG